MNDNKDISVDDWFVSHVEDLDDLQLFDMEFNPENDGHIFGLCTGGFEDDGKEDCNWYAVAESPEHAYEQLRGELVGDNSTVGYDVDVLDFANNTIIEF